MRKHYTKILLPLGFLSFAAGNAIFAQSPGGVSLNNTVWLKANTGVTLNALNNVTTWAEQSGALITGDFSTHNPGASGTTQNPPAFFANGLNFNPNIHFVSTNPNCISSNNLITGQSILSTQQMTMFQVINLKTTTGTGVWCKWQTSNTSTYRLGDEVNNNGTNNGQIRLDFRGINLRSTVSVVNTQTLYTGMATATQMSIRLNGSTNNTATVSATFAPSGTARLSLGNENEAGADAYPTTIDIAEFILYNRALTALERNQVESYLAIKYGMTLTQTGTDANDYTNSSGTVIWNRTANTPYLNNITGVGRDDASGLNQKQSLSIHNNAMVTMYNGNVPGVFPALNVDNTNDFAVDQSYVIFGDNHLDTLVTHCSADGRFSRMNRTWKVQTSGTPGDVTLALQKANVPPQITSLIVSNDPTFATGNTFIPIQDNGTQLYAAYTFTSGQYFTFGTPAMALNGVVTNILCAGDDGGVTLNPTGGTTPITYSWNSSPVQTTQNLTNVTGGNYTVTVTQGNGCSFTESYVVTGNAAPVFVRIKDTANTICTTNNGIIDVTAIGGTPAYTFSIDNGPFGADGRFTGLGSGYHPIKVRDNNNCEADTGVILKNYSYNLTAQIDTKNAWCDAGGFGGEVSIVVNGGDEPYSYFWDTYSLGKGPKMTNLPKGTYKITVTDVYGCSGSATGIVEENSCCFIGVPNAFSPNNDGKNDEFVPMTNRAIPTYEMSIFNRWGQRVFYTTKFDEGWDGTYQNNGKAVDGGTYFYKIVYTCERGNKQIEYHGDLSLIR